MTALKTVFQKEMLDGLRDKRSVFSAFIFPLMAPVLVYGLVTIFAQLKNQAEETVIAVSGIENAPALINWLKEKNVKIEAFDGDPETAVREKKKELVLVIPDNYGERFADMKIAIVEIVNDGSRTDTTSTYRRLEFLIRRYSNEIAALRLIARGVSPQVMRVVDTEDIDVASKQQLAVAALNFLPFYIILAAFVSGMGIAVDSTAGERERKTLEPLLINPIHRYDIVFGKWLASSLFAATGMIMTLVLCVAALLYAPLREIGLNFRVTMEQTLLVIFATTPIALLVTSMQMLLGIFAKSFKDAQSYIGILTMLPVVPFFIMILNPFTTQDWMYAIPMMGQLILITDVLGMKETPSYAYIYSFLTSFALGAGIALITARLFQRESIQV